MTKIKSAEKGFENVKKFNYEEEKSKLYKEIEKISSSFQSTLEEIIRYYDEKIEDIEKDDRYSIEDRSEKMDKTVIDYARAFNEEMELLKKKEKELLLRFPWQSKYKMGILFEWIKRGDR